MSCPSFVLSFVLVIASLLLFNGHFFSGTNAALLDAVCSQVINKDFCLNDFGSDPQARAPTITLPQLAQLAIDKAELKVEAARAKIDNITHEAINPNLRTILKQCDSAFLDAASALNKGLTDVKTQNYIKLSLHSGMVSDAGSRCENAFHQLPNLLEEENQTLALLGGIINVAANLLIPG